MELLSLRAQRAKVAVDRIDAEVAQQISDSDHPEPVKNQLTDEWSLMIKPEEEKSKVLWEKTAKNLRDSPRREAESQRVVEVEGKTYASVARKPKPGSKKPGESASLGAYVSIPTKRQQPSQEMNTAPTKNLN